MKPDSLTRKGAVNRRKETAASAERLTEKDAPPGSAMWRGSWITFEVSPAQHAALGAFADAFKLPINEAAKLLAFVAVDIDHEEDVLRIQSNDTLKALQRGEWSRAMLDAKVCGLYPINSREPSIADCASPMPAPLSSPFTVEVTGRLAAALRWSAFVKDSTPEAVAVGELVECVKMPLARSFSDDEGAAGRWLTGAVRG